MANYRKDIRTGRVEKEVIAEIQPQVTIKLVNVQSLIDARITYSGRESGEQYVWEKAGAIVSVDERDVPELLAKRRGKKPCCGQEQAEIFQLA